MYPEIIDDVHQAVLHLRENAENLGISDGSIVLMGHSSGAHAAALLGTSSRYFGQSKFVSAIVGLSGPYDLPLDNDEVISVFPSITEARGVKPIKLVSSAHPVTLLLYGTDDRRVEPWHTLRYEQAFITSGVQANTHMLEGVGHAGIIASVASPLHFLNSSKALISNFLLQLPPR